AGFWNDHDAVAYEIAVSFELLEVSLVQDLNSGPDARVLVDDCAADQTVWSDSDARITSIDIRLQLIQVLIEVGPHHQNAFEPRPMLDAAPNPDHRILYR